jgi:hypothetical protein
MPTSGEGAIGALDYTDAERRALATQSLNWTCPVCHVTMANALPEPSGEVKEEGDAKKRDVQESQDMLSQLSFAYEAKKPPAQPTEEPPAEKPSSDQPPAPQPSSEQPSTPQPLSEQPTTPQPSCEQQAVAEQPAEETELPSQTDAQPEIATEHITAEIITDSVQPEPHAAQAVAPILGLDPPPVEGTRQRRTGPIVPIGRLPASPSFLNPWTAAGLEDDAALFERLKTERKVLDSILAIVLGMLAWLISNRLSL